MDDATCSIKMIEDQSEYTLDRRNRDMELSPFKPGKACPLDIIKEVSSDLPSPLICFFQDGLELLSNS